MFQYSYSKLQVAYNDAFRQLLHKPRWCSASRLFVFHNVLSFIIIIISGFGIYGAAVVPDSGVGNTWQRLTLVLHEFLSNGLTPFRLHDGDNLSDHDPIVMKLDLQSNVVNVPAIVFREKVAWYKPSDVCLDEYRNYHSIAR